MSQPISMNRELLEQIIKEVMEKITVLPSTTYSAKVSTQPPPSTETGDSINPKRIPVGVSVRHVHVCKEDLEKLFGKGAELHQERTLYQGDFAAKETVSLIGPKMRLLERVRILGPMRDRTQVELAKTDAIFLGIDAPLRMSGDIKDSAPITIIGPKGVVQLKEGCILAMRHIHMNSKEAEYFGLKDNDLVNVRVGGPSAVVFENVVVRVSDDVRLQIHLDTDEGNVANINCKQDIEIIKE